MDARPHAKGAGLLGQRQQLLRVDYEASAAVGGDTESALLLEECAPELARADAIVISDYHPRAFITPLRAPDWPGALDRQDRGHRSAAAARRVLPWLRLPDPELEGGASALHRPEAAATHEEDPANRPCDRRSLRMRRRVDTAPRGITCFRAAAESQWPPRPLPGRSSTSAVRRYGRRRLCARHCGRGFRGRKTPPSPIARAAVVVGKHGTATVSPDEMLTSGQAEPQVVRREDLRRLAETLRGLGKRIVT